jgi:hypothetical protein
MRIFTAEEAEQANAIELEPTRIEGLSSRDAELAMLLLECRYDMALDCFQS